MKDNHAPLVEAGSAVFQSWLTQWKITVVSDSDAKQVLHELLQSHSQFDAQHPFWLSVATYLNKAATDACAQPEFGLPALMGVYEMAKRVQALDAPSAKLLLQYLASVNELKVDQKQFWQMANDALSRYHAIRKGQDRSHRKPQ